MRGAIDGGRAPTLAGVVYLLGLLTAVLLAVGFVLQQHAAEEEPASLRLSPRLLVDLAQRPRWLLGITAMVIGQVLGATALKHGAVALVEPLLAANLLFALPLTALYHRLRVEPKEILGAVVLIAGLAVFVTASQPTGGSPRTPDALGWALTFGALAAALAVLLSAQRRARPAATAALLAAGAGLLFGMQDTLTQAADGLFDGGVSQLTTSWVPYTVLALALFGLLLAQSAFGVAPLSSSLPAMTAVEPLAGITLGIALYREHIRTTPLSVAGEVLGLLAIVGGIVILGRSPLVTGEHPDRVPEA